jgi:predicted HTH transcriptional regulator
MPTKDPVALLRRILEQPFESEWLEFKLNNTDAQRIGETISACANGAMLAEKDKAFIVWGVDNDTKEVVGTNFKLLQLKKGGENLVNWLSNMITPKVQMEFLDFEYEGKTVSVMVLEPAYDRPVSFQGAGYIRIGENVRSLKDYPDRERTLWLSTGRRRFEDAVAISHQTPEQVLVALGADAYYSLCRIEVPSSTDEKLRMLQRIGCIRDDGEGGFDITNLGALLFAKRIADFPTVANKAIRVIRYIGVDKTRSEGETTGKMGYAIGFQGVLKHILAQLPSEESFASGVRARHSVYSEIAIREVTANALVHQDFTIPGSSPIVEIYADRVEISNPGSSLVERNRIIDERRTRNERLARTLRELGICEERGGGLDKSILDIEEKYLPAPEFHTSTGTTRVILSGPRAFGQLSKVDRIWACYCHCVVRWLRRDFMSNTTLRQRFSLGDSEYQVVSAVIPAARKEHLIKEAEAGQGKRNARYVPYFA